MADIDRVNFARAALEQAISESSGRSADVRRNLIAHIDLEKIQGPLQFQPAAADKTRSGRSRYHRFRVNQQRGLLRDLLADADLASHDCALRLLTAWIKRALYQNLIEPHLFHDFATSEGLATASDGLAAASPGRAEARTSVCLAAWQIASVNAETARFNCSAVVHRGGINTIVSRIFLVNKP